MKRTISKIAFLLTFLLSITLAAQTTTDDMDLRLSPDGFYISYTTLALDSAETVYSQSFSIASVDEVSFTTYPFNYGFDAYTADSVNMSAYWFVSFDNVNWIVADTIATITSVTATKGTFNLNNVKAPYNKIKVVNNTGGSANSTVRLGIYHPAND